MALAWDLQHDFVRGLENAKQSWQDVVSGLAAHLEGVRVENTRLCAEHDQAKMFRTPACISFMAPGHALQVAILVAGHLTGHHPSLGNL
jgi:hypothetical protein